MIPFNKPFFTGKETQYIADAVVRGKISGDGHYTGLCHKFFEKRYGFNKCLLTTSCTDALELAAILIDIQPGDEVIMPSFTFVSTANAFVLRGAKIVFVDSRSDHPGMDEDQIEMLITSKTKAIVPVHYAGIACDMDNIMELAERHDLFVVEDAAQAIDSTYMSKDGKTRPLGSIGHLSAFSFHETKNIISGEGGMLVINDDRFIERAEIIREKGTNRSQFFRGEIDKYGWVDIGSSFLPSEIISAFLYAQLENLDNIQKRRIQIWNYYYDELSKNESIKLMLPNPISFASNNGHMFYLRCSSLAERNDLIKSLKSQGIMAVFHYIPLHSSEYYLSKHDGRSLNNCDSYSDCLVRLPFYYNIEVSEQQKVVEAVRTFYNDRNS